MQRSADCAKQLVFGFALGGHPDIYYIWYIALVIEAVAVVGVSMRWRLLSFKHTHLTKRMGLLTLIILGEGIIGVTKTVNKVVLESAWDVVAFWQFLVIAMTIVRPSPPQIHSKTQQDP